MYISLQDGCAKGFKKCDDAGFAASPAGSEFDSAKRTTDERRRAIEALAQAQYEASDPNGVPWVRRTRIIREAWLRRAEQQISEAGERSP